MQKVIVDTNVLVSALIQRSYPYRILYALVLEDKIRLCISQPLLVEYYDVLGRSKFRQYRDFADKVNTVLAGLEIKAERYYPTVRLNLISDKDDNKILELADVCLADFVITGNTTDFTFPYYKQTKIVTPREYWEQYRPGL
jgi:putative PIN family toxin of toxin-antitoxin system